jgi:mannose-1-phosphate guanylyltransferase
MDWAIIIAGGSGTRFWPLSSPSRPKQLLPLTGSRSTAQETLDRLGGFISRSRILVVTGADLAEVLSTSLNLPRSNFLVEPRPASTGPALVWATHEIRKRDPEAGIVAMHADWAVGDPAAFVRTAGSALEAARRHDRLITVGIVPSRPETGYGYIIPGDPLDPGSRKVERFEEKPDAPRALDLMSAGALWNSGLFAWTAERLLAEVRELTPEIAPYLPLLDRNDVAGFFASVVSISIDVGVLERTSRIAVLPGRFDWDDVGTWEALARVRPLDRQGNIVEGPVHLVDANDCIIWSEGIPIVASGVKDLVIVSANNRILIATRAKAAELKQVLERLPPDVRELK